MKNSLCCPKCTGRAIWRIDPLKTDYRYSPGTLPIHLNYKQDKVGAGWLDEKHERVGTLTAYICKACGYSELWADGLRDLAPDPEQGVTLLGG